MKAPGVEYKHHHATIKCSFIKKTTFKRAVCSSCSLAMQSKKLEVVMSFCVNWRCGMRTHLAVVGAAGAAEA